MPDYLSKVFAQVWLVGESASQRYVAQRRFSLQQVLSCQLDATPDHECVRQLFAYRAVSCLFVITLTCSRIEERDYVAHPFVRLCRIKQRTARGLTNVPIHFQCHPPHVAATAIPSAQSTVAVIVEHRGVDDDCTCVRCGCTRLRSATLGYEGNVRPYGLPTTFGRRRGKQRDMTLIRCCPGSV